MLTFYACFVMIIPSEKAFEETYERKNRRINPIKNKNT